MFGVCDSHGVFVNISWEIGLTFKAVLFLNFTNDLLTNVQMNLLNCKYSLAKINFC